MHGAVSACWVPSDAHAGFDNRHGCVFGSKHGHNAPISRVFCTSTSNISIISDVSAQYQDLFFSVDQPAMNGWKSCGCWCSFNPIIHLLLLVLFVLTTVATLFLSANLAVYFRFFLPSSLFLFVLPLFFFFLFYPLWTLECHMYIIISIGPSSQPIYDDFNTVSPI